MNKILKTIITVTFSFILFGCADKVPFKEQMPMSNSALVYVYAKSKVLSDDNYTETAYALSVDDKHLDVRLVEGEYTTIDLKAPSNVKISATLGAIITKTLVLDVHSSQAYYLRATIIEGSSFKFEQLSADEALKELKKTVLSGSSVEDTNEALAEKAKEQENNSKSKIDKIKEAHKLYVDGVITQEEFKKLKKEILDAN